MADSAHGASITFGTSSWTAEVIGIRRIPKTRRSLPTSHSGTSGAMTFIPADMYDTGGLVVRFLYNPNTPPVYATAETITLTFPTPPGGSTPATLASSGFLTEDDFDLPTGGGGTEEGLMEGSVTIKFTGAETYVDST